MVYGTKLINRRVKNLKRNDKFVQVVAWLLFIGVVVVLPVCLITFILNYDKFSLEIVMVVAAIVLVILCWKPYKFIIGKITKKSMRLNKYYVCIITKEDPKDKNSKKLVVLYNNPLFYFIYCDRDKYFDLRSDAINKVRELHPDALISTTTYTLQDYIEANEKYLKVKYPSDTFLSRLEAYDLTLRNIRSIQKWSWKRKFEKIEEKENKTYIF